MYPSLSQRECGIISYYLCGHTVGVGTADLGVDGNAIESDVGAVIDLPSIGSYVPQLHV